ncbi:MAG: YceI family protein [Acidobacteriota bacterium]
MRKNTCTLVFALLISAALAHGATETYSIDQVHSQVGFSIRHFFSKVPGKFTRFAGTLSGDRSDLQTAKVSVEIEAASIDTGNNDRDKHLRSADFFDVEKYPKITFDSKSVRVESPTHVVVTGDLSMHGVTKSVDLQVDVLGFGPDGMGGFRAGFEAKTKLNRKDFGVVWNKILEAGGTLLGDQVEITINVEAIRLQ